MIGCGEMQINLVELEQLLPKLADKDGVPVTDYGLWQTIELDNIVQEQLSYCDGSVWMFHWEKVSKFSESINNHQDY